MSKPVVQHIGWVLVHFLWQGAAIALLLACGLYVLRRRSPQARWLVALLLSVLAVGVAVGLGGGCSTASQSDHPKADSSTPQAVWGWMPGE